MDKSPRLVERILDGLPTRELTLLKPHLELVEMRQQSLLVETGDDITHAWFPQSGAVSMVVNGRRRNGRGRDGRSREPARRLRRGRRREIAKHRDRRATGDGFDLEVEQVRVAAARSEDFRALLRRHERAVLVQAQQCAACNTARPVESGLSLWLLHVAEHSGGGALAVTQDLIARTLGIQRNSVTIATLAVQGAGLVYCSRGHIEIIDG